MSEDNQTKNRSSYQREYYLKNKERILKRRQNLYTNSEEYRKKINRQRRTARLRKEQDSYQSAPSLPSNEEVEVEYNCIMKVLSADKTKSHVCKMYTITAVAMKLKLDKKRLEHLVYLRKVPRALYRNANGWRMYTEYQMEILVRAFAKFRKQATLNNYKFRVTKDLCDYIHAKFETLVGGIPAEKFTDEEG